MQNPPTWLIANWKMYGNTLRVQQFAYEMNAALADAPSGLRGVFCPPTPFLGQASLSLPQNARLHLGAQDCHTAVEGAHTGEVSAAMLKDIGCRAVIVGHSERRAMGETDALVLAKAQAAIAAGLLPVICLGESLEACESGQTEAVLRAQMKPLEALTPGTYLIAYEPVWAIGSGKTPKCSDIGTAHRLIKSALGSETIVLYGGSVNPGNIGEILSLPEVHGALIGGASLDISKMRAMIDAVATTRK